MAAVVESVRLYTVATVAQRLEVGVDWVYERIASGVLPVVELGDTRRNQRIRADHLQEFINSRTFGQAK
ncbi:helix-turn-helix domain-containing protein [Cryobacterium soli]|uniref:helix-turn-helix domain-containing protein n=1 Tax=Cryobacterium soli TaxID=2220095 RepID=UPI000E74AE09|nr:helix-turn-helix domain-containing protein [Cryobacterium soli]